MSGVCELRLFVQYCCDGKAVKLQRHQVYLLESDLRLRPLFVQILPSEHLWRARWWSRSRTYRLSADSHTGTDCHCTPALLLLLLLLGIAPDIALSRSATNCHHSSSWEFNVSIDWRTSSTLYQRDPKILARAYNFSKHCPIFIFLAEMSFLANVNSRSRSLYAIARPSVVCLSVCLSVTFVRPTQAVQIFRNISTALGTWAIRWRPLKILRRSSQGNPSAGWVKHKRGSKI